MLIHTTLSTCPIQTDTWIKTNDDESLVVAISPLAQDLLGFNPVHESMGTLWQKEMSATKGDDRTKQGTFLATTIHRKTLKPIRLCVCSHSDDKTMSLSDVSNVEGMHENGQVQDGLMIMRLSPYGTIETLYCANNSPQHCQKHHCISMIGKPIMRFVHSDDVIRLCRALSQATRSSIASVHVRCQFDYDRSNIYSQCTIFSTTNDILCIIQPVTETILDMDSADMVEWPHIEKNSFIGERLCSAICQAQERLWYAVRFSVDTLARHMAVALVTLVQLLSYDLQGASEKAFLERSLRVCADKAKMRPEVDRFFSLLEWTGIVTSHTAHTHFNALVDCGTEWLIARTVSISEPLSPV